jgi:hypothetical protein
MEKQTITLEALKRKAASQIVIIDEFMRKINSDPLTIVANTEKLIYLQKEYQLLKTLDMFVQVLEENLDPLTYLERLQGEIMDAAAFKSSSLAENTIESYRFDGKREAYLYLKKLLK